MQITEGTVTETGTIRVVIVEDDRSTRDGLKMLVAGTPGFRCLAAYGSVEEALRDRCEEPPEVILLDIHLPGMPGSEGVKPLRAKYPRCAILMLTVYEEEDKVFESICNGADGYLLKKTPPAKLLDAIREARDAGAPMSPEIARKVIRLFHHTAPPAHADYGLTPHEVHILKHLADGFSYQALADRFGISINTVRNHIRSIYEKLHVHSKSAAVGKALRGGIL